MSTWLNYVLHVQTGQDQIDNFASFYTSKNMDMRMDLSSQTLDRKSDQIETTSRPFLLKRGSDLKMGRVVLNSTATNHLWRLLIPFHQYQQETSVNHAVVNWGSSLVSVAKESKSKSLTTVGSICLSTSKESSQKQQARKGLIYLELESHFWRWWRLTATFPSRECTCFSLLSLHLTPPASPRSQLLLQALLYTSLV